jgi:hypothetical protein
MQIAISTVQGMTRKCWYVFSEVVFFLFEYFRFEIGWICRDYMFHSNWYCLITGLLSNQDQNWTETTYPAYFCLGSQLPKHILQPWFELKQVLSVVLFFNDVLKVDPWPNETSPNQHRTRGLEISLWDLPLSQSHLASHIPTLQFWGRLASNSWVQASRVAGTTGVEHLTWVPTLWFVQYFTGPTVYLPCLFLPILKWHLCSANQTSRTNLQSHHISRSSLLTTKPSPFHCLAQRSLEALLMACLLSLASEADGQWPKPLQGG